MTNIEKWSVLAGLRFVLASVVAFNHLQEYTSLGWLAFIPQFGAFEAILGFLLISGFSISHSYRKEPGGFLLRRLKRLYPIYLASIVLTLAVDILVSHWKMPPMGYLVSNVFFLNQFLTTSSLVGPAWSLSLEFWLYCIAPVLMITRPSWNRLLVYLSFSAYLIYTAGRTLLHLPYYSDTGYGANLLLLSYLWICGLRLASPGDDPKRIMWDIRLIFFLHIAMSAGIQFLSRLKHHAIGLFLSHDLVAFVLQSATLCLVYMIFSRYVVSSQSGGQRSRLLRFLGDVSYPLYLIHIPIYVLLSKTRLAGPITYYAIAVIAASALYWSVDFYSKKRHLQLGAATKAAA